MCIATRDGLADVMFEVFIQGCDERLLHADVRLAHFFIVEMEWASVHRDHQSVFRELSDLPIVAHDIEDLEQVASNPSHTLQTALLVDVGADLCAVVPTYVPYQVESGFAISFVQCVVETADSFRVTGHRFLELVRWAEWLESQVRW